MTSGGTSAVATLTVTPSTGLHNEQTVDVAGTGFAPGELAIAECTAAPTGPESCDLRTVSIISPDPSGAVAVQFTVVRTLLESGHVVHCEDSAGTCTVIVTNIDSSGIDAFAPLAFAAGPRPNPHIAVAPNANLTAGDTVAVTGTGFIPNGNVTVEQCVVGVPFCNATSVDTTVNGSGGFVVQFPVSLRTVGPNGQLTTCLAVQCVVEALNISDFEDVAVANIGFDPNQPPPPVPSITVTPATGLHHNQTVTVAGTGFEPNGDLELTQCPPSSPGFCLDALDFITVGGDGTFSDQVRVSRLVTQFSFPTQTVVDCIDGGCTIAADEFLSNFELSASAPIGFDPSDPPPAVPVVTAAPLDNLPFRAAVTVHGTGFSPGEQVFAERCVETDQFGDCSGSFTPDSVADANGEITLVVAVKRISQGPDGAVDCVDPKVTCSIEVFGERSYEQFSFPITFDPNAPIPPPPTITVAPNSNLGYRQAVRVQGSGFTPGVNLVVEECALTAFPDAPTLCAGSGAPVAADQQGALDTTFAAHRIVFGGFSSSVDCAAGLYTCVIAVGELGEFDPSNLLGTASAPVRFDPNSVPPPPPTVVVTPSRRLVDGQLVAVSGAGFSPNASVGLALCKPGPLSYSDCDISRSVVVPADGNGGVATKLAVHAQLQTNNGVVDCTAAPGACVLGVANLADPVIENSLTPLSFFVPPPDVIIGDTTVSEDGGFAKVEVLLSRPSTQPVRVEYVTHHQTARAGSDYVRKRWGLRFAPGVTRHVIRIQLVDDHVHESTESFRVVFQDPEHAHIVDDTAIVTIRDND